MHHVFGAPKNQLLFFLKKNFPSAHPLTGQHSPAKVTAKAVFDFTAENEDELTLKV